MTDANQGGAPALPFSANINWTQLLGLAATLLALFGIKLDPATQTAAVAAIAGATAVVTWVLHTFVNHPGNVAAAQALVASAVSAAQAVPPAAAPAPDGAAKAADTVLDIVRDVADGVL